MEQERWAEAASSNGWRLVLVWCATLIGACGSTTRDETSSVGGGMGTGATAGVGGLSSSASGSAGSAGSSGASGSSSGTAGTTSADQEDYGVLDTCPADEPCAAIAVGSGECPMLAVPPAICVMEHLRDRVPGRFVRSDNLCSAIGSDFSESIVLNLGGDMARRASTRRYGMPTGSGTTFSPADLCVLKDAAYFDACAQELGLFIDTSLTFELSAAATLCLSPDQWFTSCAPERASCEPAR